MCETATRAALGRRREIVRGFGGDIAEDGPMTEEEATFELGHRFGPGPHWVIADHTDTADSGDVLAEAVP